MHQRASRAMGRTFNRLLHFVALAALIAGLAPTAAEAATARKATVAKRPVHSGKRVYRSFAGKRQSVVRVAAVPARPSYGQIAGLHSVQDQLDLKSSVALVVDQETREVLFSKNDSAVLPI